MMTLMTAMTLFVCIEDICVITVIAVIVIMKKCLSINKRHKDRQIVPAKMKFFAKKGPFAKKFFFWQKGLIFSLSKKSDFIHHVRDFFFFFQNVIVHFHDHFLCIAH